LTLRALGQFAIKPIERPVEMIKRWPAEIAIGSRVISALRQQEIPRGFECGLAHALTLPNRAAGRGGFLLSGKG
jgi:hypothetical protein